MIIRFAIRFCTAEEGNRYFRNVVVCYIVTMEKVQINVNDKVQCMVSQDSLSSNPRNAFLG